MVYSSSERLSEPLREPDPRRGSAAPADRGPRRAARLARRDARPLARARHRVDDANVSRRHAEVRPSGGSWIVARPRLHQRRQGQRPPRRPDRPQSLKPGDVIELGTRRAASSWSRTRAMLDPVAVALKFGFLAVLYLFLLWMARSALKDLRRTAATGRGGAGRDADRDAHAPAAPARPADARSCASARGAGLRAGAAYDLSEGALLGRGDQADIVLEDSFASSRHARLRPARRRHRVGGPGLDERDLPQRRAAARSAAAAPGRPDPHRRLRVHLRALTACCASPSTSTTPTSAASARATRTTYFVRAPLFVVADGMGGAQAGEVASELAVEPFEGGLPDERDRRPRRSSTLIRAANAQIHEQARTRRPARRHGHHGHRRLRRTTTRSSSPTSATRAATCCATAS